MSGNHSRNKGHNYERELVHLFRAAMPGAEVKRGLQAREGHEAADVECPVFWVEAKRGKKPNMRAALKQAEDASTADGRGKVPIAVVRDDRERATVTMRLDDFLEMVSRLWAPTDQRVTHEAWCEMVAGLWVADR